MESYTFIYNTLYTLFTLVYKNLQSDDVLLLTFRDIDYCLMIEEKEQLQGVFLQKPLTNIFDFADSLRVANVKNEGLQNLSILEQNETEKEKRAET